MCSEAGGGNQYEKHALSCHTTVCDILKATNRMKTFANRKYGFNSLICWTCLSPGKTKKYSRYEFCLIPTPKRVIWQCFCFEPVLGLVWGMWLEMPTQDTCKFLGSWKGSCVVVFFLFGGGSVLFKIEVFIVVASRYSVLARFTGDSLLMISQRCVCGQGSSLRAGGFWGHCLRAGVRSHNSCHFMRFVSFCLFCLRLYI